MATKGSSVAFVALMLFALFPVSEQMNPVGEETPLVLEDSLFQGFLVGGAEDVWNDSLHFSNTKI